MSLAKKLARWKEQQFITQAQCDQILAFERQRSGHTFWRSAFIFAGLLIGLGICLLVAANWKILGDSLKIIGDFILLGGLFYTTFWCITHQKKGLTELFAILSFLMIGATIGLIGQVFNLEGGWNSFALFWALLGLPFVIVSRGLFFNLLWLCLFLTVIKKQWWWLNLFDYFWHERFVKCLMVVAGTCLLSFAGGKLDKLLHQYTLLPKALEKLMMWIAYCSVWGIGLIWGTRSAEWHNNFPTALLALVLTLAFFAGRMFLAVRTQNLTSFRRNAIMAEIYIFILFASAFGNLFMSGIGFILGGLSILGLIYVFKRTSRYIKNMEVFK